MSYVYVVMGYTGEYSDHTSWAVCAYEDEDKAEKHALKAEIRAKEMFDWANEKRDKFYLHLRKRKNDWDPDMMIDYTGTTYAVIKVPRFSTLKYKGYKTAYDL